MIKVPRLEERAGKIIFVRYGAAYALCNNIE